MKKAPSLLCKYVKAGDLNQMPRYEDNVKQLTWVSSNTPNNSGNQFLPLYSS